MNVFFDQMIYYAEGLSGSAIYVGYYPINFAGPDIVPYAPDVKTFSQFLGPEIENMCKIFSHRRLLPLVVQQV